LADYFAIVGLDPKLGVIESLSECPKTIETCSIVVLEKKSVTDFKARLMEAKAACTIVEGVEVDPLDFQG
jgi:hypothetical protein